MPYGEKVKWKVPQMYHKQLSMVAVESQELFSTANLLQHRAITNEY
jgi:hypothetical protein